MVFLTLNSVITRGRKCQMNQVIVFVKRSAQITDLIRGDEVFFRMLADESSLYITVNLYIRFSKKSGKIVESSQKNRVLNLS